VARLWVVCGINELKKERMDKKEAEKRAARLRKLIDYNRTLYHTFDAPEIDDAAFDTLKNELEEIENKYPDLVKKDSPTQKIGGTPLDVFVKVQHSQPMHSFFDAFSREEIEQWLARLEKYLGHKLPQKKQQPTFYCELKIDGLAIELVYKEGVLAQASTRGDGLVGEDITQNVKTITTVPNHIEQLGAYPVPKTLVVRGEIFITQKELDRINKEQEKKGQKPYANTRNLAAGSMRQLDPAIAAARNLQSFQYDIVTNVGQKTHEEQHRILASWGFFINTHNKSANSLKEVFDFRDEWQKKREKLEYEIDGIVVIVNDDAIFKAAGIVGKGPRGAIAYKFSPRQATTIVENIVMQVGRSGVITPVATLRPVEVSGVTIQHATLHNFDEIERLDVRMGDTVIVTRSGDVIPKIIQVLPELRSGKEKKVVIPKKCPVDGSVVVKDGVLLKCSNPSCGAQNRNRIIHFVSRSAFGMEGLGEKIIDRLLDEGLISDSADIFSLALGDIKVLDRFGEKSAHNIIESIEKSKKIKIHSFLYALGIPHVGQETAKTLEKLFVKSKISLSINNVEEFFEKVSLEGLQNAQDIGPIIAQSIKEWFGDPQNKKILKKLADAQIALQAPQKNTKKTLEGMIFVITGTLSIPRQRIKEMLEERGAHVQTSLSENVDALIVGQNPGSKEKKAQQLGIVLWDEKTLQQKLKK